MAKAEMKTMVMRKKLIPLVMALGNMIINELGFVEKIDTSVEWDKKQWGIVSAGFGCPEIAE